MTEHNIPHLAQINGQKVLVVHGKPFYMLCGEVHNSSSSVSAYMKPIWDKLDELKCNSVLLPVAWERVEPEEGRFDFSLVDELILQARCHGKKIGFLWFGSWKNAQCSYVPGWVKGDTSRFRRAEVEKGKNFIRLTASHNMPYTTMSAFCEETNRADAGAFRKLMEHIRDTDGKENTVILVQVENETGLRGGARECSDEADRLFGGVVPQGLIDAMVSMADTLETDIRDALLNGPRRGSWNEVFGPVAEEIFTAYYTARYVENVAAAGKKAYPLPMVVNAWLVQGPVGTYPAGGPTARAMEIWKYAAPDIDIYAPDIYVPYFTKVCEEYTKLSNPLFIPEVARHAYAGSRLMYAIGHCHCICFSPFGIEELGSSASSEIGMFVGMDTTDPLLAQSQDAEEYAFIQEALDRMMPVFVSKYGTSSLQAQMRENTDKDTLYFGNISFLTMFNVPVVKSGGGAILIARIDEDEFYILAKGCVFIPQSEDSDHPFLEYYSVEEGYMENGRWHVTRYLNGDEVIFFAVEKPQLFRMKLHLYH